jgi:hypothetical protein
VGGEPAQLFHGHFREMVINILPLFLSGVLGMLGFPASLIAGVLWGGIGAWQGWGGSAPFYFGAALALIAAVAMMVWMPRSKDR